MICQEWGRYSFTTVSLRSSTLYDSSLTSTYSPKYHYHALKQCPRYVRKLLNLIPILTAIPETLSLEIGAIRGGCHNGLHENGWPSLVLWLMVACRRDWRWASTPRECFTGFYIGALDSFWSQKNTRSDKISQVSTLSWVQIFYRYIKSSSSSFLSRTFTYGLCIGSLVECMATILHQWPRSTRRWRRFTFCSRKCIRTFEGHSNCMVSFHLSLGFVMSYIRLRWRCLESTESPEERNSYHHEWNFYSARGCVGSQRRHFVRSFWGNHRSPQIQDRWIVR